jgi:hypothetical protein
VFLGVGRRRRRIGKRKMRRILGNNKKEGNVDVGYLMVNEQYELYIKYRVIVQLILTQYTPTHLIIV